MEDADRVKADTAMKVPGTPSRMSQMPVSQVMATNLVMCEPTTTVARAAQCMHAARSSSIVVVDGDRPVGIWTEHDALRHDIARDNSLDDPISSVMSTPVQTIDVDATVGEVALRFQQQNFRHYLVVGAHDELRGIVSRTDIVVNHGVEWFMRLRTAGSVVRDTLRVATAGMTLSQVARAMHDARTEAMVVHDGDVWGILTERDIVRFIGERMGDINASEVASKPLATVGERESLFHARNVMLERGFRHIGVVNDAGELVGLVGFGDILDSIEHGYIDELESALRERETALRESEERYRALVEHSPDAIVVHRAGRLLFVNQAGTRLLGCNAASDVIGRQLTELLCPEHEEGNPEVTDNRLYLLNATPSDAPVYERIRRFDDRTIDVEIAAMQISYDGMPASQLVLRDISRRKQLEDELRRLATTDQLTGAYNRLHFETHLDQMMKEAQRFATPLSLAMFDVDHFKEVNDVHGHFIGDEVLRQLVALVSSLLRDADILARWGGEEFIVLAPDTDARGAVRVAEKVRASVSEQAFGHVDWLTLSCGVAQYRSGETREELFQRVDNALYAAKAAGRNQVYASR